MAKPICVKVSLGEDIRRMTIDQSDFTADRLYQRVAALFGIDAAGLPLQRRFTMKYDDDEGDKVTLATEDDVKELLRQKPERLRLQVVPRAETRAASTPLPASAPPGPPPATPAAPAPSVSVSPDVPQEPQPSSAETEAALFHLRQRLAVLSQQLLQGLIPTVNVWAASVMELLASTLDRNGALAARLRRAAHTALRELLLSFPQAAEMMRAARGEMSQAAAQLFEPVLHDPEVLHHKGTEGGTTRDGASGHRPAAAKVASWPPVHLGVVCDGCGADPIEGVRYKSRTMDNFDLCQDCMADPTVPEAAGEFVRIDTPLASGCPYMGPHYGAPPAPFAPPMPPHFFNGPSAGMYVPGFPPPPPFDQVPPVGPPPTPPHFVPPPPFCPPHPGPQGPSPYRGNGFGGSWRRGGSWGGRSGGTGRCGPGGPTNWHAWPQGGGHKLGGGRSCQKSWREGGMQSQSQVQEGPTEGQFQQQQSSQQQQESSPQQQQGMPGSGQGLDARFVADITIEDGCQVAPGTHFVKIWRVRNSGTVPWPATTHVVQVGGDDLGAPVATSLAPWGNLGRHARHAGADSQSPDFGGNDQHVTSGDATSSHDAGGVPVGAEMDIAVDMRAPMTPGRHVAYFRLADGPDGRRFGHRMWCFIQVDPCKGGEGDSCKYGPAVEEVCCASVCPTVEEPESPSTAASMDEDGAIDGAVAECAARACEGDGEVDGSATGAEQVPQSAPTATPAPGQGCTATAASLPQLFESIAPLLGSLFSAVSNAGNAAAFASASQPPAPATNARPPSACPSQAPTPAQGQSEPSQAAGQPVREHAPPTPSPEAANVPPMGHPWESLVQQLTQSLQQSPCRDAILSAVNAGISEAAAAAHAASHAAAHAQSVAQAAAQAAVQQQQQPQQQRQ